MSMLAALDWAGAVGDIAADPLLDTESRLLSRVVVVQKEGTVQYLLLAPDSFLCCGVSRTSTFSPGILLQ